MAYRTYINTLGHLVREIVDDSALTDKQKRAALKRIEGNLTKLEAPAAAERVKQLEAMRQERLTREAFESLTPEEREQFNSLYGPLAITKKLAAEAVAEADSRWKQAEQERQRAALIEWRKGLTKVKMRDQEGHEWEESSVTRKEENKKIMELHAEGEQRAQARLAARAKRELEAEVKSNDVERIVAAMTEDERKIAQRLYSEQPSLLDHIQSFIAEHRNPIENIDNPTELYRLANQKPKVEEYVPPLSDIDKVNDTKTLYKMAARQIKSAGAK